MISFLGISGDEEEIKNVREDVNVNFVLKMNANQSSSQISKETLLFIPWK